MVFHQRRPSVCLANGLTNQVTKLGITIFCLLADFPADARPVSPTNSIFWRQVSNLLADGVLPNAIYDDFIVLLPAVACQATTAAIYQPYYSDLLVRELAITLYLSPLLPLSFKSKIRPTKSIRVVSIKLLYTCPPLYIYRVRVAVYVCVHRFWYSRICIKTNRSKAKKISMYDRAYKSPERNK
jgi:hypothetical protein